MQTDNGPTDHVIRVERLSKRYRVQRANGRAGYRTLREELGQLLSAPWRRWRNQGQAGELEEFWALKDVSFNVDRGEILGIVGRNGAGKSTLLKILSRITRPTEGTATLHGRVGTLLEVGTGFHPELSGRENVFLSGAILGMKHSEIRRQFDAIVDFAEIERFLEVPVKRYSSGMYVRLAFAVAAHLDPHILLVDEVLAVGDVGFQKKCLGKMSEVAKGGRTVLFVSHNNNAIRRLCTRAILITEGRLAADGTPDLTLAAYSESLKQQLNVESGNLSDRQNRTSGETRFLSALPLNADGKESWSFACGETWELRLSIRAFQTVPSLGLYLALRSTVTNETLTSVKHVLAADGLVDGEEMTVDVRFPDCPVRPGEYGLYICLGNADCSTFYDVLDSNVGLPSIVFHSQETDRHRTIGYFSMPAEITIESRGTTDAAMHSTSGKSRPDVPRDDPRRTQKTPESD